MLVPPFLINNPEGNQEGVTFTIKLDPSIPVFVAMARLFVAQGQYAEAVEICRLGLRHFPDHLEGRLLMAISYFHLGQPDKGLPEIQALASSLNRLVGELENLEKACRSQGQESLADWAISLAGILARFPKEGQEKAAPSQESRLEPAPASRPGAAPATAQVVDGWEQPEIAEQPAEAKLEEEFAQSMMQAEEPLAEVEADKEPSQDSSVIPTLENWLSKLKTEEAPK